MRFKANALATPLNCQRNISQEDLMLTGASPGTAAADLNLGHGLQERHSRDALACLQVSKIAEALAS